jgi:HD superfamily phosphohydrolase
MAPHPFEAVNLISDPIHGYIELTKRVPVSGYRSVAAGGTRAPVKSVESVESVESVAEEDLLDTPWVQRLRRISQLQSARWVFPTAEHSRFTHGLGVMHEAGLWARALYPSLRETLEAERDADGSASDEPVPSEALVVETLRVAGLLHDVGHGPFAHFFDDHVLSRFAAPPHASRDPAKRLSHEDLSQAIIERELGRLIRGLRRTPAPTLERGLFEPGESIDPRWVSFLVSKPPLAEPTMPLWVRRLQPLFSGVFTVDNLDYVRRDAYMTGVASGPIDAERLRRYSFMTPRGLALYEPGLGALEQFLITRLYLYDTIYFHRTVRAIDLDLAEAFGPSIQAIFGEGDPLERLGDYLALDEYALLHQAALWARGELLAPEPMAGDGHVAPLTGELWRGILLRRPGWRAVREVRRHLSADDLAHGGVDRLRSELLDGMDGGTSASGCRVDLAEADSGPYDPLDTEGQLIVARRDGSLDATGIASLLERLPAMVVVGRLYEPARRE